MLTLPAEILFSRTREPRSDCEPASSVGVREAERKVGVDRRDDGSAVLDRLEVGGALSIRNQHLTGKMRGGSSNPEGGYTLSINVSAQCLNPLIME